MSNNLGTKRICAGCATKFYDLSKKPIKCPKCSKEFIIEVMSKKAVAMAAAEEIDDEEDEKEPHFPAVDEAIGEFQNAHSLEVLEDISDLDDEGDMMHIEEVEEHNENPEFDTNSDDASDEMFIEDMEPDSEALIIGEDKR